MTTTEPKFKIGDRVVYGNMTGTVTAFENGWYTVAFDNGRKPHCCPYYSEHELKSADK